MEENLLIVGKILRPHGNCGAVLVRVESDLPQRFDPGSRLLLEEEGAYRELVVEDKKVSGKNLILKFTGIFTRDDAEKLRGELVARPVNSRLPEGEFWVHELLGLHVVSTEGEELGIVRDVLFGPVQDLLEIEGERGVFIVPFVAEFVKDVDINKKEIVIKLIEGLVP